MANITNSTAPNVGGTAEMERDETSGTSLKARAGQIAEKARAHPTAAAAAGAAVIAGIAAAAIPLTRGRKSNSGSSGKSNSSRSKKSS